MISICHYCPIHLNWFSAWIPAQGYVRRASYHCVDQNISLMLSCWRFSLFTWTLTQPHSVVFYNGSLRHIMCAALLAFQDERDSISHHTQTLPGTKLQSYLALAIFTQKNAPLFINCHSEAASVNHSPFDVASRFEWLFMFHFSHPSDCQRH